MFDFALTCRLKIGMNLFQEQDWSQSDLCLAPSNRISKIMDLEKVLQSSWTIQRDVVVRMNETVLKSLHRAWHRINTTVGAIYSTPIPAASSVMLGRFRRSVLF